MTVGGMVGGHGREWAACLAPTPTHHAGTLPPLSTARPLPSTPTVISATTPSILAAHTYPRPAPSTAHTYPRPAPPTAHRATRPFQPPAQPQTHTDTPKTNRYTLPSPPTAHKHPRRSSPPTVRTELRPSPPDISPRGSPSSAYLDSRPVQPTRARRSVVAGCNLPRTASSHAHPAQTLTLSLTQDSFTPMPPDTTAKPPIKLKVKDGYLVAGDDLPLSAWLPCLPLAPDVHAESATLTYAHSPGQERAVRVVLGRPVREGETPALWFSSEVAAHLGLPFLTFSHVRGGVYTCPSCLHQFPAPNPLKVHLAAGCLAPAPPLTSTTIARNHPAPPPPWLTPLLSTSAPLPPHSSRGCEGGSSPRGHKPASPDSTSCPAGSPPQQPRSAFRRVGSSGAECSPSRLPHAPPQQPPGPSRSYLGAPTLHPLLLGAPPATSLLLHPRLLLGTLLPSHTQATLPTLPLGAGARGGEGSGAGAAHDPSAEMETLVSNLGRSRRGHLCLYCGKVYSRKYGLKIHIRTHTGYKPLKCQVCLRPFGDPSNLNKHVRLHAQGHTPYRCGHCGKVLVRRRDLDRHIRSRHPQHPHHPAHPDPASPPSTDQDDHEDDDEDEEMEEEEEEEEDVLEVTSPDLTSPHHHT